MVSDTRLRLGVRWQVKRDAALDRFGLRERNYLSDVIWHSKAVLPSSILLLRHLRAKSPFQRFNFLTFQRTSVPTMSPNTTRFKLCGFAKSNTMIGILLSMHSENAVESI